MSFRPSEARGEIPIGCARDDMVIFGLMRQPVILFTCFVLFSQALVLIHDLVGAAHCVNYRAVVLRVIFRYAH